MSKGKVAVVTDSTAGIGLGIARALAAAGADLMINGFGEAAAIEKLCGEIAVARGVRVAPFGGADLSKPADATGLIEHATREFGRVAVLVNNAGIQHVAPVHAFPLDRWDAVIAINLTAVVLTPRAALSQMLARDWGRIINIASVHGLVVSIDKSAHVVSRHGVVALPKVWRWRRRPPASPAMRSVPGGCLRRWCKSKSTPLLLARSWISSKREFARRETAFA